MRDRACRTAERGDSLRRRPSPLRLEKLPAHGGESLAEFSHLAAAARLNRICIVSSCQGADARNEVVERPRDRARKNTEKKRCQYHRGNSDSRYRGIELADEMAHRLEGHQHVALNRGAGGAREENRSSLVLISVERQFARQRGSEFVGSHPSLEFGLFTERKRGRDDVRAGGQRDLALSHGGELLGYGSVHLVS